MNSSPKSPEKIGRYKILSEVGRGGMATVFHAYDPNFERDVAIKVLPPALLHDPQFRTRFEREAKMIALLEHPAIVPVYDFGEQDGQPYIVMRYMAGGSLADRLKEGALSLEETKGIITRMAPALDAAHVKGIIHRDLKPGNILFDQYGNAFLSDFGIARLVKHGSATLTGTAIIGTPAYMSPEQIQGEKDIDGRSDVYALGVLIFQMLTGQAPYKSDTPAKVMMMHILEPVPNITEVKPDLPERVEAVLSQAMAKDREDRFATATELADSMELVSRGEGTPETVRLTQGDLTMVSPPKARERIDRSASSSATVVTPSKPGITRPMKEVGEKRRSPLPVILILMIILIGGGIVTTAGLVYVGLQGNGPLAMLAPSTTTSTPTYTIAPSTPSETPIPATTIPVVSESTSTPTDLIPEPTSTPTPTPSITPTPIPTIPVIGGADKIAFINAGDIWVANLDGSELKQLTTDGTVKNNLQWTIDGDAITYLLGNCVQSVTIENGRVDIIICFNFVDSLTAYEVSPDGAQVAISLDNQLYIVPTDMERLNQVKIRSDLTEMAECKDLAPYQRNFVKAVRWSFDGSLLAAKVIGVLSGGIQGDIIKVLEISNCVPNPHALDNFPPPRFTYTEYESNPVIQNFTWDGHFLFALTSVKRNDGFGDLYTYNMDLHKARMAINPIDDVCCYRDPQWSPDGNYLVFAFQNYLQGSSSVTQLYYIPYGSIGTGAQYTPLPLPEITDPREKPQPVLRPASSGN